MSAKKSYTKKIKNMSMVNNILLFKIKVIHALFFILKFFRKKEKDDYILLINYNNLGDLICDTPSLREIRHKYEGAKILLLVRNESCVSLMKLCPYIDEIIIMPHSKEKLKDYIKFAFKMLNRNFIFSMQFVRPFYEIKRTYLPYIINVKNRYGLIQEKFKKYYNKAFTHFYKLDNTTTRTEESLKLVELLGIKPTNKETECWIDKKEVTYELNKKYIIIQTCATLQSRMWHKDYFIKLIYLICDQYDDLMILLTGTKEEENYIQLIKNSCKNQNNIKVLCSLNISSLLNLIKNAKLLITNDTGPFHFARALKTPIIALFGISPPEYLIEEENDLIVAIRGEVICKKNCPIKNSLTNCQQIYKTNPNQHCINNISPDYAFDEFNKLYKKNNIK